MYALSDSDVDRLKKFWLQSDILDPSPGYADTLLEELFEGQGKSLKDSIRLLSGSISRRKTMAATKTEVVGKRLDHIQVALQQFPLGTCYPHLEARRAHLERELDELFRNLKEEEVSAWKDLHHLYREQIYITYKERNLGAVKRAVRSDPSGKG